MSKDIELVFSNEISRLQATNYHLLRTAINSFSKTPADLNQAELDYATQQAQKQYEIEQLVLGSDEANNVIVPDAVVQQAVDNVRSRYESEESYIDDLKNNNLSEKVLESALQRELKVESVLGKISSNMARINDIDIKLYYYLHKDKFTQPESRVAKHILITINEEFEENTREESLQKITAIRKRVVNKPKRFEEQAAKHSECPTALSGGMIGNIPRGQLFPELDEVLFSLKEGEISAITESDMGFHIIFCEKIYADGPVDYKRAEGLIKEKLLEKRRRICQRAWLKKLADKSSKS